MKTLKSDLIVICLFVSIFILPFTTSRRYRGDYVYNRKVDAFYKFHMESLTSILADEVCSFEGAKLMVPSSQEDISQAHEMFKMYPDIGDIAWAGNDGKQHESAEETPIIDLDQSFLDMYQGNIDHGGPRRLPSSSPGCDVIKRDGDVLRTGCYQILPFICKVDAVDVLEDKQCKVFDRDFRYYPNVGSCYKIPGRAMSWNEAYSECRAVGAHLVVINSETEQTVIYNLTNEARHVKNAQVSFFFFAGFRAERKTGNSPIVFKTIFNQTLKEAGFEQWDANEPNNFSGKEYCGTIFKNFATFNDYDCTENLGFICEKEVEKF